MPTILMILGWRIFFYFNEERELAHVHAKKGDIECKYWLKDDAYNIEEAWSHGMTHSARREIRKIIFDHFEYILGRWNDYFNYF